jgi:hypothetical protein
MSRRRALIAGAAGLAGLAASEQPATARGLTRSPIGGQSKDQDWRLEIEDKLKRLEENLWPGVVFLDDFGGTRATDDDRLTAALSYCAAQSQAPTLQLPARPLRFTKQRVPYSGMKIVGASGPGSKNLEVGGGHWVSAIVTIGGGQPWWNATGLTLYDVYFGDIAFRYEAGTSFWDHQSGTLWASEFHSLTHYGSAGVFGSTSRKALLTQVNFTGKWDVHACTETPFHIGGSDCDFWTGGSLNMESEEPGNGNPLFWCDYLSNTNIGPVYITSPDGWRGILVNGSLGTGKGFGLNIWGVRCEGRSQSIRAYGNLLRVTGGGVSVRDIEVARPMSQPLGSEHGAIEITGGDVSIDGICYDRAGYDGPMVYVSGGTCRVSNAKSTTGDTMVVKHAGGTVTADDSVLVQ